MDDKPCEEEAHKNRTLHINVILVVAGGLGESDEEKESEDEDHLVVGGQNGEGEEEKVNDGDPGWNWIFALNPAGGHVHVATFLAAHFGEFFFEKGEVENVGNNNSHDGLPTEIQEHEVHAETPFLRDHEHGRSCKMGESSADRDIHEKEPEGGVGEFFRGIEIEEFFGEKHGRDRHGGGLGDERSQDGSDGEGREPPGGGRSSEKFGDLVDHGFCKAHNRAGGCDGHDDDHKHGLGEVDVLTDVILKLFEARAESVALNPEKPEDGCTQGDHPNPEDCFYLAEEMEEVGFEGNVIFCVVVRFGFGRESKFLDSLLMSMLVLVSHLDEESAQKGVNDGTEENDTGDNIEATLLPCPEFELFPNTPVLVCLLFCLILRQWEWKGGVLVFVERVFLLGVGWMVLGG